MVINYTKSPTESIDQYNTRIAAERAAAGTEIPATSTTTNPDTFLNTLKDKLMSQAGAISSEDTNIEKKIQEAVTSVKSGNTASAAAITSAYDRQISDATVQGNNDKAAFAESQRGFGVNTAAARAVSDAAEKRVKDLEQRKQELILQGDAAAAGQVSGLIMKELEFEQQARIQTFSNLLNIGNFGINALEAQLKTSQVTAIQASDVETFTDANGNVTAKNKVTGKTLWTAKVGRSGSATPNIQVQPIADPITGNVQYFEQTNKDTGKIEYRDVSGNLVDPANVQIGKKADPMDVLINGILGDMADEMLK